MNENLYKNLLHKPGIYRFYDHNGRILYVGKSKDLHKRVAHYFQRTKDLEPAKQAMVKKIARVETTIVATEMEALLLEAVQIRKYQPPYNVMLKDDKSYQYIKITVRDTFPVITSTRRITRDGSKYYGPYTSGYAVKETLRILKALFPFHSCTISKKEPCLEIKHGDQIGPLRGGDAHKPAYDAAIKRVMAFLSGRDKHIIAYIKKEMEAASQKQDFERAAFLRDKLNALNRMLERQNIISANRESLDILGLATDSDIATVNVFRIRGGRLLHQHAHAVHNTENSTPEKILQSFAEQYYTQTLDYPKRIIVPFPPADTHAVTELTGATFAVPQRGRIKKLLNMSADNATDTLRKMRPMFIRNNERERGAVEALQKALNIRTTLRRIETYDISNFQGKHPVGSMVVFTDGKPDKSAYRKFAIRGMDTPNDFAMMKQVLERRLKHTADKEIDWPKPDLIVIDGGKGQLHAASTALELYDLAIPVISLAKREEEIFMRGKKKPLVLSKRSAALQLMQRMRDEAHRFAIGYYRTTHEKHMTKSALDDIPGIGPKTKKQLLKTFGSVAGIRNAPDERLRKAVNKKQFRALREGL